jgi:transcription antitermination factor NusG
MDVQANAAPYWCTIQCQPHRERVAERFLRLFGFEVYLPRVRRHQILCRRRIERLTPLVPGYCFTRIELQWHGVKQCPGVIGAVGVRYHHSRGRWLGGHMIRRK